MSNDPRWSRVKALFQDAIERPASERAAFLAAAAGTDDDLRREVESLLSADAQADCLDQQFPVHGLTNEIEMAQGPAGPQLLPLPVGSHLGTYAIGGLVGVGAMGEVYRAHDAKLDRDVALKVVPQLAALDPDHLSRVTREAQLLASLNHPNIATIYGLEEFEGVQVLVLELVDGLTLAERIAHGALPMTQALLIARKVAEALEAAHRKGIVHRDLKPANIKVASNDTVKVLDFGLARADSGIVHGDAAPAAQAAVGSGAVSTLVVGSPAYMSPEQTRGGPVDTRTDVWAFGCLLYEMLTGTRAFSGDTVQDVIAAVQNRQPDWVHLPASTPAAVRTLIRRCLEKDRARRMPAIGEAVQILAVSQGSRRRGLVAAAVTGLLVAVVGTSVWELRRVERARWARNVAIPEISELASRDDYARAFALAGEVQRLLPDDPVLDVLWPRFSAAVSLTTVPDAADVYVQAYASRDERWDHLGRTPLASVRLPLGVFKVRIEKGGYETQHLAAANPSTLLGNATNRLATPVVLSLVPAGTGSGMVSVPGGSFPVSMNAFSTTDPIPIDPFSIDRYEVTNAEYKRFVDSGGYTRAELWTGLPLQIEGRNVAWHEAVATFRDSTGAVGPSTWASGTHLPEAARHPVGGVSWFEAVAYCRSQGKTLPTLFHWRRAALSADEMFAPLAPAIIAESNFGRAGPSEVGSFRGLGPYGTFDMAGNVKEWSWNEAPPGHRWIQGGAWSDQPYMLVVRESAPASDRAPTNGFRCARYDTPPADALVRSVPLNRPPRTERAAAVPELFDAFRTQYLPIQSGLNSRVEATDRSNPDWVREKISFDAGYENERVAAYLFLPKGARPPYQVVMYFPGRSSFVGRQSSAALQPDFLDFIVKSGRALVWPVYKGSYERWIPTGTPSVDQRRLLYDWRQDIARLLDVLSQRQDVDADRFAYLGLSYGASVPISLLSLEDRFKAVVLMSAALGGVPGFPNADALDYAARIRMPVLLLSGRHDFVYPLETVARPLFDRLGTPADRKRHVVFDAGHMMFPRGPMTQEVLGWLTLHLGPAAGSPSPGG